MVLDLRAPFAGDVLERGGGHHAEADQEHVSLGVGEGAQSEKGEKVNITGESNPIEGCSYPAYWVLSCPVF